MKPLDASFSKPLEGGPSFSLRNRLFRALWIFVWAILSSWTPPQLHRWRVFLLQLFGAKVHPTARVYGSARIWHPKNLVLDAHSTIGPRANIYCMALTTIGERSVISQDAQLCSGSHDINNANFQLVSKPIFVGSNVWIAANAFVGPGVVINSGAVIGANAVIFKDADPNGVYVGNPAKKIKTRDIHQP